ncbi:hypothetical protein K435DRAFT_812812 [Dendrothele bispora CBS 962.96]|uniref:Myb/SANT-like domain-containing protein n=1 Tax=Dendrothele bispora (strain CBS 962.96) TaxID=1314807 RepID=A0A4S8KN16_DENBC|nr:hypothetical protein K435DRAFT_812812 [Dendrothele bispora CBS 962.96]
MTQSEDKENQPIEASTTDDAAPLQKKRGRPKGSKNKPKDGSKTKTPDTATTVPETVEKPKAPHPRAIYSDANDKKLMEVFLEHKQEGNGTDNGGWKSKAITATVAALAGSELESGDAPKSATSIRDHWDHLKRDFNNISTLLEKSGWGWDDENQCVQADDEQWEALAQARSHFISFLCLLQVEFSPVF